MVQVLTSVALYTGLVLLLVAAITAARRLLLPRGKVTIRIEGAQAVEVPPGGKLHSALASHGIFLPAACGGSGTCGLCRLRVHEGGGALLPTERVHIARRDARLGVRLACQVAVKRDLRIELPPEVWSVRRWRCRVRSNRNVATFIRETILDLPPEPPFHFRAGGYVQVEAPPHEVRFDSFEMDEADRATWRREGLLDLVSRTTETTVRAYSMANDPGEGGIVRLNVRIATPPPGAPEGTPPGRVSSWIYGLRPGDEVTISGPFGEFFIQESRAEMVYIGGGAGMAPLRSHLFELLERRRSLRRISYWYGARSLRELFYREEFERLAREHPNFRFEVALSEPLVADDWKGPTGFIHKVVFDRYLRDHPAPEEIEYYLCGPPPMLRAVRQMLDALGVEPDNIHMDDFGG